MSPERPDTDLLFKALADPSRRKTVAQNALEAGNQYVRIPDAHAH